MSDSLDGGELEDLRPGDIAALPGCYEASYLVVAAVDLSTADGDFAAHAFLGGGNTVYASTDNLYVASSSWFWRPVMIMAAEGGKWREVKLAILRMAGRKFEIWRK